MHGHSRDLRCKFNFRLLPPVLLRLYFSVERQGELLPSLQGEVHQDRQGERDGGREGQEEEAGEDGEGGYVEEGQGEDAGEELGTRN